MPEKTAYEHGARKLMANTGPDPSDEFSQKAAENRKPPHNRVAKRTGKTANPSEPDKEKRPPRDTRETPADNPDGNPSETKVETRRGT